MKTKWYKNGGLQLTAKLIGVAAFLVWMTSDWYSRSEALAADFESFKSKVSVELKELSVEVRAVEDMVYQLAIGLGVKVKRGSR